MFLLLAVLTITGNLFAQCPQQFAIEICESELQTAPQGSPDGGCADDCHTVYYWVYLTKPGNPLSTSDEIIQFTNFHLTGTLNVLPNISLGSPGLSEVNVDKSITCSPETPGLNAPGTPNSPLISYDPNSNAISYEISSTNYGNQLVNLTIQGRTLLFVLAVDVFPGESVQPAAMSCLIKFANNPNPCVPPVWGCNGSDVAYQTLTQPITACNNGVTGPPTLKMDEYASPIPGYPNRKLIPVYMAGAANNTNNFNFTEIDFLMTFSSSQSMYMPAIEAGRIPKEAVKVYPVGSQYRIYVKHQAEPALSIEQNPGYTQKNILFYIVIDGPVYESECATVTVSFTDFARMDGSDFSCCRPNRGSPETVEWIPSNCITAFCNDINFGVYKLPPVNNVPCNNYLSFQVVASSTQNNYHITGARFVIEIQKTGTLTYLPPPNSSFDPSMIATVNAIEVNANLLRLEVEMSLGDIYVTPALGRRLMGVVFSGDNACIEGIAFRDAVATYAAAAPLPPVSCIPTVSSVFKSSDPGDDICTNSGVITAVTEDGEPIEGWSYYTNRHANYTDCPMNGATSGSTYSFCSCPETGIRQNVTLKKVNDYANGLTTYDLVLISRHILNLEPLTGFKLLAADANMSGTVSTGDIVELRKLILGTITELTYANSWRFTDKTLEPKIKDPATYNYTTPFHVLQEVSSPPNLPNTHGNEYTTISTYAPNRYCNGEFAEYMLPPTTQTDAVAEFVGFKVGDVDKTAVPNNFTGELEERNSNLSILGLTTTTGKKGNTFEVPVTAVEGGLFSGWQMAFTYDPEEVNIEGVRCTAPGTIDNNTDAGWHIPRPGELRMVWFNAETNFVATKGAPLFFIKVRLLKNNSGNQPLFTIAERTISSLLFAPDGTPFRSVLSTISENEVMENPVINNTSETTALNVYPNPTSGHFRIDIRQEIPGPGLLIITDMMGKKVGTKALNLIKGSQSVTSASLPKLESGQYELRLETSTGIRTTRLVVTR